jgi:hypothetical protein
MNKKPACRQTGFHEVHKEFLVDLVVSLCALCYKTPASSRIIKSSTTFLRHAKDKVNHTATAAGTASSFLCLKTNHAVTKVDMIK